MSIQTSDVIPNRRKAAVRNLLSASIFSALTVYRSNKP